MLFSSSLPQLLTIQSGPLKLEPDSLIDSLIFGRVLPPYTLYRGIHCLAAGQELQLALDGKVIGQQLRQAWDWASTVLAYLENENTQDMADQAPEPIGRRLVLQYEPEFAANPASGEAEILTVDAAGVFDAIPATVNASGQPLGDLIESTLLSAVSALRAEAPLHCDLATELLLALPHAKPALTAPEFLASSRLRRLITSWRELREPLLWQPVKQVAQRSKTRLNPDILFRLCHILPERRLALATLATSQQLPLHFVCADTPRLARRIANVLRGAPPTPLSETNPRRPLLLQYQRFPDIDEGYTNPYQRAVILSHQTDQLGIDDVNRFFHLQAWPMHKYRRLSRQPVGALLEQRLCSILSTQYLLNFASPVAN